MAQNLNTSYSRNSPIINIPFLDSFGLNISNNPTSPNTSLLVASGQIRDLSNTIDMSIGNSVISTFNPLNGNPTNTPLVIDATVNGVNGLDRGSLLPNTVYFISIIADSHYNNRTAALLAIDDNTIAPVIPVGYDSFRLIGYAITDSSSHFIKYNIIGGGHHKDYLYNEPQATAITSGNSTTYTFVDLTSIVAAQQIGSSGIVCYLEATIIPNAPGDMLNLQPANATTDAITIIGNVAGQPTRQFINIVSQYQGSSVVTSGINYKVSSALASAQIRVCGFSF